MSNVGQKERKTQTRANTFLKYSVIQNMKSMEERLEWLGGEFEPEAFDLDGG